VGFKGVWVPVLWGLKGGERMRRSKRTRFTRDRRDGGWGGPIHGKRKSSKKVKNVGGKDFPEGA